MHDHLLLIDKPVGFSSFQIVRMLKARYRKVGHAGTLDPFASGLLIMLVNRATKKFDDIQKLEKEYVGEMLLGIATDTYDITGTVTRDSTSSCSKVNRSELDKLVNRFTGEIEQTPPRFSALKQHGRKLYELSRKNQKVKIQARKVFVKSFDLLDVDIPILRFRAVVGKGVYIRSLANDLGEALGCGATLLALRRTRIGEYAVTQARKIGALQPVS